MLILCLMIDVPLCKAVKIGRDGIQVAVKRKNVETLSFKIHPAV